MKCLPKTQLGILLFGTLFAYTVIITDFIRFYRLENTFFKFKDCAVDNPLVTPCFYGGFAFLLAFVISYKILKEKDLEKKIAKQKKLLYLLISGVLFAWGNFFYTVNDYLNSMALKQDFTGCSGVAATNPLLTPCFGGAVIFLAALIVALYYADKLTKGQNKEAK